MFEYRINSYGVSLQLQSESRQVVERLVRFLPPHMQINADCPAITYSIIVGPDGPQQLLVDGAHIIDPMLSDRPLEWQLESHAKLYVAEHAPAHVFVHAGVVTVDDRAVVIPGRSFTGKTTLVAALLEQGATYASDEFAVFDEFGMIHPFPRPLMVRRDGRREMHSPDQYHANVCKRPVQPAMIICTRFERGTHWRPQILSPGQTTLQLLDNTVSARREPARALKVFGRVVPQAACLEGPRGDAHRTATEIMDRLDHLSPSTPESDSHATIGKTAPTAC